MIARRIGAVVAAAGLATAPLATDARVIRVGTCGGAAQHLVLPADPARPNNEGGNCVKACHAMTDRRDRLSAKRGCC
ncbi:hypothetical protein [Sphingopyxis macrogoltabida]|uniref:Uncharacterized protein n=1 Tax=Sphingopyxis macrogoltabida TaxID=33050 RepID=A0AAC9FGN1_SPHMC|nr:hypothetical protein [Sphingopyxis macrogoltabida]ALJ15245.1 hypothetical protein LH19_20415 [Sphingopyxis macrogoltabida]AMU91490.1 hypothetical protein ATM17_20960 [Sphingopyxis macrogoltabida]